MSPYVENGHISKEKKRLINWQDKKEKKKKEMFGLECSFQLARITNETQQAPNRLGRKFK